ARECSDGPLLSTLLAKAVDLTPSSAYALGFVLVGLLFMIGRPHRRKARHPPAHAKRCRTSADASGARKGSRMAAAGELMTTKPATDTPCGDSAQPEATK